MNKPEQKLFPKFSYPKKTVNFILTFAFGLGMALGFAKLISFTSSASGKHTIIRDLPVYLEWLNGTNTLYLSLVLAGALGGLLYSILLDGELELPYWSKKNPNNLNPGFLAEIFVGISGAFIAYSVLPQELKQPGDQGLEITIFVTGLVGGYGGKAILDAALEKVINRIKTANLAKEKAESQAKELEEKTYIRNLVNQQIQEGLNQSELSEMQEKLEGASDDVKKIVFNLAHDARSLGRRTLTFKDRVNRTIPIFEALVASDNNNASYNAELGYAYISSQPADLDKAISYLDRAIELRVPGASTERDSWKYEMNRAIARIGLGNSQSRDDILKDLFAVEQRKGLAQAIDEYESDGVDGGNNSIKNWLIQNQDWLSQQTNGKALLDEIQLPAAAKPVTSTSAVTQNQEDLVAATPNTIIKATTKTYLKRQPIDSSQLGENEKKEVPVGTEHKILKHSQASDGHCLVELDYGQGIWYIWSDHWHLPWQESSKDNSLSSVSAPESSQHQGGNIVTRQQPESVYDGKALPDKIQLSAAAKPVTSTSAVTQNREDLVAAPPNTKIKATIKTYLKKQPIDSSELGENEKKEVPAGKGYKVLKYSEEIDGHFLVELDYGAGIWYLWSDHWHLPWQKSSKDNGRSSVSAPEATDKAQPGTGQIPQRAIELIKEFEGCEKKLPDGRVQAYPDPNPKTGWKLPTIGYGSTRCPDGSPVRKGQIITRDEAEEYLMYDLDKIRRPALEKIPTWKDMNENQRAALYSFSFNLGSGFYRGRNFESITKVCDSPQRWNDQEWVKEQFVKYRNPGTNVESGLRRRREAEAKLFCTPPSTPQPETVKAATSTTTAQSFGSLDLGNDLASRIIKYMKTKGYQVFTNPREYNIVYVEGMNPNGTLNDDRPNEFNDLRMVIEFKNGKPEIVGSWEATTEPGDKYTYSPQNPNGAARIKFGQYQAWIKAWHPMPKSSKSHEALFQTQPIEVYRDSNKDFRRDGDRIQKGIFGINQHWGYDLPKNAISGASAGCLVGRTKQGHKEFMAIIKQDKRYLSDPNYVFYTTVIPGDDLEDV
ncbi:MAG: glycoside hydrolase family protein [Microcystis sp.]|uniref:glycoside hydrolase family protein n=1 Tax=Microcystis sp. TaxID=1127 RepID=UPI00391CE4C7